MRNHPSASSFQFEDICARSLIAIDPRSGQVLFERDADQRGQVASTQKLLTALLIARDGDLDAKLAVIPDDEDCYPFRVNLASTRDYTRKELLACLLIGSANDAARALARHHAGSLQAFGKEMNKLAGSLGMADSHFTNPNGLPDERQYSTARDLAKLARAVDTTSSLRQIVSMSRYRLDRGDGTSVAFENTNLLLKKCNKCDGMKSGFTRMAGHCLIASGEAEGRRRIVVLLGGRRGQLWEDCRRLLEWSLAQLTPP
jgi:serine-type D-Ala-D-Ala carboxypeptidase (penicillin-binding protein 5/6)